MAGIPLNTFKTVFKNVMRPNKVDETLANYKVDPPEYYFVPINNILYPPSPLEEGNKNFLVYTAPLGVTTVILYAHVSTIAEVPRNFSMWHYRPKLYPVAFTQLLNDISVPNNDALIAISGKLVLETGDALYVSSSNSDIILPATDPIDTSTCLSDVKLTLSILETANQ